MAQATPARAARRQRYEALALPHTAALYGTAMRLLHNERDAEDLVQDTLLRAYQAFDQFVPLPPQDGADPGGDRFKPWLFRILTNTFINRYRRRALEQRVAEALAKDGEKGPLSAVSQGSLRAAEDLEGTLAGTLLSDDVRRALDALPEEFRLAVLLCDVEDFSYREIADIMDCPVGTVMSRLYRGRRLLKESLRGYAEQEGIGRGRGEGVVIPLVRKAPRGGEG